MSVICTTTHFFNHLVYTATDFFFRHVGPKAPATVSPIHLLYSYIYSLLFLQSIHTCACTVGEGRRGLGDGMYFDLKLFFYDIHESMDV